MKLAGIFSKQRMFSQNWINKEQFQQKHSSSEYLYNLSGKCVKIPERTAPQDHVDASLQQWQVLKKLNHDSYYSIVTVVVVTTHLRGKSCRKCGKWSSGEQGDTFWMLHHTTHCWITDLSVLCFNIKDVEDARSNTNQKNMFFVLTLSELLPHGVLR